LNANWYEIRQSPEDHAKKIPRFVLDLTAERVLQNVALTIILKKAKSMGTIGLHAAARLRMALRRLRVLPILEGAGNHFPALLR
jgi:hypothetical protein